MRTLASIATLLAGVLGITTTAFAGDGYGPSESLIRGGVTQYSIGNRDIASSDEGTGQTFELSSVSAYNIPIWRSVSVQLDLASEYYYRMNEHTDAKSSNVLGMHLSYRDPNRGLLGLFAANAWSDVKTGHGNSGNYDMAMFGAEAQLYRGNWTLYGQAGFANNTKGDPGEGFNSGWFVRGVARYFFRPDTKLEAEVSYAEASPYIDGDDKGKFTAWGVSIDHKLFDFRSYPIYGTLAYRGAYYDATTEEDHATEHVFKAGIKILFGAATLQQNDRHGATLDLPMLPVRANSLTESLD
jgi:hypothetical protein